MKEAKRLSIDKKELKKKLLFIIPIDLIFFAISGFLIYKKAAIPLIIVPFLFAFVYTYLSLFRSKKASKKKEEAALEREFVKIFGFLEVYLTNKIPVYSALLRLSEYSSPLMKRKIETLIEEIDGNKTVEPYVHFAESFTSLTIKEVMISLYLLVEQGENEHYLRQFSLLFSAFSSEEKKLFRERKIATLANTHFFPLVGSGVTMIMISVGIMSAIGGIIGG